MFFILISMAEGGFASSFFLFFEKDIGSISILLILRTSSFLLLTSSFFIFIFILLMYPKLGLFSSLFISIDISASFNSSSCSIVSISFHIFSLYSANISSICFSSIFLRLFLKFAASIDTLFDAICKSIVSSIFIISSTGVIIISINIIPEITLIYFL